MIPIQPSIRARLKLSPEYGMGYQVGTVSLNTGGTERGIILNGTYFVPHSEIISLNSIKQILEELSSDLDRLQSKFIIESVALESRPESSLRGVKRVYTFSAANEKRATPAKDAEITLTSRNELFKRFSAYENDFRVTEKGGLVANTYATTAKDAENITTGMEAISRYSLENKRSANKVFTIAPPDKTRLKQGIVEPDYGELGGGVEVIFVDGSPDGTVSGPEIIPEK
jgi:hypothetical protein